MRSALTTTLSNLASSSLQRVYDFEVLLPVISGTSADEVSRRVIEIEFGDYDLTNRGQVETGARQQHYQERYSIDAVTLTVLEKEDRLTQQYFLEWRKLMTKSGLYHEKRYYAKTIEVFFLKRTGGIAGSTKLYRTFPLSAPKYKLSYRESGVLMITITLSVDYVEHDSSFLSLSSLSNVLLSKADLTHYARQIGFDLSGLPSYVRQMGFGGIGA